MNGIEALTTGLKDAGRSFVTNFPGSKSQVIFEKLGGKKISINEKVAYESAYGASLAGKRSVVCMKNVGLNVASDPYLNSIISGVNAGLVLIIVDDLDVVSSQHRMDSRHYFDFYGGLWLEPSSIQEMYEYGYNSFSLSEEMDVPVCIRLTNQNFNLGGHIKKKEQIRQKLKPVHDKEKYLVHPTNLKKQEYDLIQKNKRVEQYVESNFKFHNKKEHLIISFGCNTRELDEYLDDATDLMNLTTLPIPLKSITRSLSRYKTVSLIEQGDDYVYKYLRDTAQINKIKPMYPDLSSTYRTWEELEKLFSALKSVNPSYIVSDLTQFTRESTGVTDSCLCLGASISTAMGIAQTDVVYPFAIVGDTSFLHGGFTALLEVMASKVKMGIIIIDNNGSWCTGGQQCIEKPSLILRKMNLPINEIDLHTITSHKLYEIIKQMKNKKDSTILYINY